MNQDNAAPSDRPLLPPEPEAERGLIGWIVAAVAVLLIVVGAYQAYKWLVSDVAHRRAVAEGSAEAPQPAPAATPPAPDALGGAQPGRTIRPPQPSAPIANDPLAPAVAGNASVNKCVVDGQVTYTNEPCPEGAEQLDLHATGADPNGVSGSVGDGVPVLVPRPSALRSGADPSQQDAACRYLAAEIARLDFEFKQPLPPPVLDHISTRLGQLRADNSAAKCAPPPKTAEAKPPAPARKRPSPAVVEEKSSD